MDRWRRAARRVLRSGESSSSKSSSAKTEGEEGR